MYGAQRAVLLGSETSHGMYCMSKKRHIERVFLRLPNPWPSGSGSTGILLDSCTNRRYGKCWRDANLVLPKMTCVSISRWFVVPEISWQLSTRGSNFVS